tara:strand:+ start:4127 stop:4558 length:432 start_codon:yes stop_codon:yes gene_type:complete
MTQNWDQNKYLVDSTVKSIDLTLEENPCQECGQIEDEFLECSNHNVKRDVITLKVKHLPWSRRNQIMTKSVSWTENGQTNFDGDFYVRECLKEMIVEAPWGKTNDIFLIRVGDVLGNALETLVPKAFDRGDSNVQTVDDIKKE